MFLPVVALGFRVAPVAGQNVGARLADRVRETFRLAAACGGGDGVPDDRLCFSCAPAAMIRIFSKDPSVIAVGAEYLQIVAWSFVASGVMFVARSMFQALGNTLPPLVRSFVRIAWSGSRRSCCRDAPASR